MTERLWYYMQQNNQMGPVPESELRQQIQSGTLEPQALVWSEGMAQWEPAAQQPAFAALGAMAVQAAALATPEAPSAAVAFAPTELVIINGEQFASKASFIGNGNFDLHHGQGSVAYDELAKVVLALALLANEQQGAVQLQAGQKKALFGLRTVAELVVVPTGYNPGWPPQSHEARVLAALSSGPRPAKDVLVDLLAQTSNNAWAQAVDLVAEGLQARGLMWAEPRKRLGMATTPLMRLTDGVAAQAAAYPVQPFQQLLASAQHGRPDLWKLLQAAIKDAINARTEHDDYDGPDLD